MNEIYCNQTDGSNRYLNPADITIDNGYAIEVFAEGLDTPSSILFTDHGDMIIANSGVTSGTPDVLILRNGTFESIARDFIVPIYGINYRNGEIYVSHRGIISVLDLFGNKRDIISGLPSYGDYSNSRVDFGPDGKMYFGQGTATNSGVVGTDNLWVPNYSFFCDAAGSPIILNGQNYRTENALIANDHETIYTGAFSPYGELNNPHEVRKGVLKASGSILRANIDGSGMELVAWGLRAPVYIKFDDDRLFVSNNGYDIRGSRPIANAPEEFLLITPDIWYGWPDYAGGEPVTLPRFRPEGAPQPEFLMSCHPNIPPRPFALFPPDSFIVGFAFNKNKNFGSLGDIYIAEFGSFRINTIGGLTQLYPTNGYKISKINPVTGNVTTFAINKSGFPSYLTREGGFGRPVDLAFGPDGALYVTDMGTSPIDDPNYIIPNTGVIWRITRI